MNASRNDRILQRTISVLMAVVLVVGLMPLPAFAGDTQGTIAAAGSDALQSAQPDQQPETGQLQVTSEDVTPEATDGKLTYSSTNLNFNLYPGYNGGREAGAFRTYTIKNTGSVKVTGIKLANFSSNNVATTEYDENGDPVTKQNPVPYVLTNENGTVNYSSNYFWGMDYWADDEAFDLNPGESKKLYFTVASPFRAGYTLNTGIDASDTVQIVSNNTTPKTVYLYCRVYNPEGAYAKVGAERASGGDVTGATSLNFGTVAAGTPLTNDTTGDYSVTPKTMYFQNLSTKIDSNTKDYPYLTVSDITIEGDGAEVFVMAGSSMYGVSRMALSQGAWLTNSFTVDTTYIPAGTYTAYICYHVSPYAVGSNVGNTTTGVIRVPMTVKVTGTNPNIPAAVTGLEATAGNGYVGLSWNKLEKPSDNVSGYVIWRTDYKDESGITPLGEIFDVNETEYVDKTVENGKTYTYYVTPRFGGNYAYAKKSNYVSATPSTTAAGRPLAPYLADADDMVGAAQLIWTLDQETQLQFEKGDGTGTYPAVDHFNIYKDGALVATYSQGSYDDSASDWYYYPDGSGAISKTCYRWIYDVPATDVYQWHKYRVSAVTTEGVESYLSNDRETYSGSDVPVTSRLEASWVSSGADKGVTLTFGWDTETWIEYVGYGITYTVERKESGGSWQTLRTATPTDDGNYDSWTDSSAVAGKTYTYRVNGANSAGEGIAKEVTIKTSGSSSSLPSYGYEQWSVMDGTLTADVTVFGNEPTTAKLRRDGKVVAQQTATNDRIILTDTPPNGTYTYYWEFTTSGGTVTSTPFAWTRAEGVSSDDMLKPPGKVTNATVKPGDCKLMFEWEPPATTTTVGAPSSYQICQYDFDGEGEIYMWSAYAITVPATENSLVINEQTNGWQMQNDDEYYFMIRSVNAAGVSEWTDLSGHIPNGDDWSTEAPAAPVIDVEKTTIQQNGDGWYVLHAEWKPGDDGGAVAGYHVRVEDPLDGSWGTTNEPDEYSWDYPLGTNDASQIPKGTYSIRVAAYNSRAPLVDVDGNGGVATTYSYTYGAADAKPLIPRIYTDSPSDQAHVRVELQPGEGDENAGYIASYKVYRADAADGPYALLATVTANGASLVYYYDTDVSGWGYKNPEGGGSHQSRVYYYKAEAVNAKGTSAKTEFWQCTLSGINNRAWTLNNTLAGLPDSDDAAAVAAAKKTIIKARNDLDALTDPERITFIEAENVAKLEACEAALLTADDKAAAANVDSLVANLGTASDIAALATQSAVDAKDAAILQARAAYDLLNATQKGYLAADTLAKLQAAESAIEVAQTRVLIAAIPPLASMTVSTLKSDRNKVMNARIAYDALSDEQRALIDAGSPNEATIAAAEAIIAGNEALVEVQTLINEIPVAADITRDNRAAVIDQVSAVDAAYNALTTNQKERVDASRLTAAKSQLAFLEAKIQGEVDDFQSRITALNPSSVAGDLEAAIAAAENVRSDYDNLPADVKGRVNLTNLEAYEAVIIAQQQSNLDADAAAAIVSGATPIAMGSPVQFTATTVADTNVVWSSDKPSVATVDVDTGMVTGVQSGTASISAVYKRVGYGGVVLQSAAAKQVVVSNVAITGAAQVTYGQTTTLTLVKDDTDDYTWSSDDPTIASVDQDGVVTAHKVGTTTIKAANNNQPTIVASKTLRVASIPVAKPTASSFTYDGKSHTAVRAGTGYTISGTATATNVGVYTARANLREGYCWTGGSTTPLTLTWKITSATQTMYRVYNQWSGEHLFTLDKNEYDKLGAIGWKKEGEAWKSPTTGTKVYRLYNRFSGDHHYTTSADEYATLGRIGWTQEGVAFYSGGNRKVYRGFNPYETIGTHHYTTDANEIRGMVRNGWKDEGVGWYCY